MTLEGLYQFFGTIFFVVASVFMITLFIWAIKLRIQIGKLMQKFEEIAIEAKSATLEFRSFIERTIDALEKFRNSILTFEFARKMAVEIIDLIKNKSKGDKNGEAN